MTYLEVNPAARALHYQETGLGDTLKQANAALRSAQDRTPDSLRSLFRGRITWNQAYVWEWVVR